MLHNSEIERVRSALSHLDFNDEDAWIKAAMGIKSEYGEDGFTIWDEWGSQYARYKPSSARARWKSVKAGGRVTIGSLFYDAKAAGWKDDKKYVKPSREEIERRNAAAAARDAQAELELAQEREAAAIHAKYMWDNSQPCLSHPYLERKGVQSHGLRVGKWEVIDHETGDVRVISDNALLIPIRDTKKQIHSLQAILPVPMSDGRDKDYVKGGAKSGLFYSFGSPVLTMVNGASKKVILVGEGYATLASGHECTGHAAIVAFDAGNLPKVCRVLRGKFPDAVIVVLADNDRCTEGNPGVKKAHQARDESECLVCVPEFKPEHAEATDINDYHALYGADAVRKLIEDVLNPPVMVEPAVVDDVPPWEDMPAGDLDEPAPAPVLEDCDPSDDTADNENPFVNNMYFRTLGVDGGNYFFFKKGKRNQILSFSTGGLTTNALLALAPMNWWEGELCGVEGKDGKFKKDTAVDFVMQAGEQVGIFDPTFMRGRGAWVDCGRLVLHLGDRLYVDGERCGLGDIDSEYMYQGGRKITAPANVMLTAVEGENLLRVSSMFRWSRPGSDHLLCGWLMLSPLCGALRWRPHAWVTGGAGSGKSTIINDYVRHLIPKGMELFANGDSTEAGLRQALRGAALPMLIDESESDSELARQKMERILVMLRQSSSDTGAQTYRGTAGGEAQAFQVRSMALLSSIGVALERQQDRERVIVLPLKSKREADGKSDVESWPKIKAELNKLARDETLARRLFARAVQLSAVILEAIDVFTEAAAALLGTAREGDQIGALMAGAWCLANDVAPTHEQALQMLERFDWAQYQEEKAEETEDLVATLMGRTVQRPGGLRVSIGKLVSRAAGNPVEGLEMLPSIADSELHNYGMRVMGGWLCVHPRNHEFVKLMKDTKYGTDLRGRLKRIAGISTAGGGGIRIGEVSTSGLKIPLAALLGAREPEPAF